MLKNEDYYYKKSSLIGGYRKIELCASFVFCIFKKQSKCSMNYNLRDL